jgi:hypothetical protein
MNSSLAIFETMNEGRPVSRKEAEEAIVVLTDMLTEAREEGPEGYVIRLQDSIERIKEYRKRRCVKPRSIGEIQRDLEAAQQLIYEYRVKRQYGMAAKWEHNRDEYDHEYRDALLGKMYIPDLKEVEGNVKDFIPEGFQVCL